MKGKIVLVPFPFTDLTAAKLRPALVLIECEVDSVVGFISTRVPAQTATAEVVIPQDHRDFAPTGLKTALIIILDKVATVCRTIIPGEIGEIGEALRKEVNRVLRETCQV